MARSDTAPATPERDDADATSETEAPETPEAEAGPPVETDAASEAEAPSAHADDDAADQLEGETAADDVASPDDQPTAEDQPTDEPFTFRVYGTEIDVPGATRAGDTITIPTDAWNRVVQPRLADTAAWQRERQTYQRQIAELTERADPERNPEVAAARALREALEGLFQEPEDELYEKVLQMRREYPLTLAQAEAAAYKRQAEAHGTRATDAETQRQVEEWTPRLQDALRREIDRTVDSLGVTGIDRERMLGMLWDVRDRIFAEAKEGDGSGLEPGQIGIDRGFIENFISPFTPALRGQRTATKADEVERKNRQATGKVAGGKKAPPTAPAKGSPAPSDEIDPSRARTREEYDALMAKKYGVPA